MLGRKFGDSISIALGEIDVVPSVQKLVSTDRINLKCVGPLATRNGLALQIDHDWMIRIG